MLTRRFFLGGLIAAPMVAQAANLMPLRGTPLILPRFRIFNEKGEVVAETYDLSARALRTLAEQREVAFDIGEMVQKATGMLDRYELQWRDDVNVTGYFSFGQYGMAGSTLRVGNVRASCDAVHDRVVAARQLRQPSPDQRASSTELLDPLFVASVDQAKVS